ncbi:hypothetical protein ACMU_15675 [Actibacterium mucosum KCTC 23349]|uniref:HTH hxlR-type domain-containing protein n=1 Tax=Actibacterium mucosum KCTC 23349 TaxID=1454373 RepID=A0A037ZHU2_9RHOB|nr:helix-turn-helix domain-containing protein [Actibacterium mucosum]KAJ55194.1 hypothetical protein ACMU_15675 [Actibacterium mucosum KCTC 23349]
MAKQTTAKPSSTGGCPLLECLSVIGGAWGPSIIWNLSHGPMRFSELKSSITQVSPKVLTTRLKELEANGVVDRRVLDTSPPSVEYSLNEFGHRLVPAIEAIAKVGMDICAAREAEKETAA